MLESLLDQLARKRGIGDAYHNYRGDLMTISAATKRALWGALEHGLTDACRAGAGELVSMWGHPDQEEGPRAFAEKRAPDWAPPTHPE